ncbi:MAG: GDYXXLXY domain-containing protein [Bacteroidota bacterium]
MKKIVIIGFVLMVIIQLYVPVGMIQSAEKVIAKGKVFKFETEPVDPYDPFRGKYITLRFKEDRFTMDKDSTWQSGQKVYALVEEGPSGFALVIDLRKETPSDTDDYFQAEVKYANQYKSDSTVLTIQFPFDALYLEESKAPKAEELYRESLRDDDKLTYAMVSILKGDAILTDVEIDGESIVDLVRKANQAESNVD